MALSLPSVPQELKPIASYLQRAEEVKAKDPVVAYWCKPLARTSTFLPLTPHTGAYYAAQVGIGLKAKEHTARTFLFDLLGVLETMKSDIGSSDAIEDESVSCAYVENFALKVFAMADNEDRRGNATRATAKKFLAAANFLEVLSVFDQSSSSAVTTTTNVPEKIRYAKWKAADIAKAFREGRKPTPGAPGETIEPIHTPREEEEPVVTSIGDFGVDLPTLPIILPSTPPPDLPPSTPPTNTTHHLFPGLSDDIRMTPVSPGAWSTMASPGTPGYPDSPFPSAKSSAGKARAAFVSGELEGQEGSEEEGSEDEGGGDMLLSPPSAGRQVRFTPSVTGGLTPSISNPDGNPFGSVVPTQATLQDGTSSMPVVSDTSAPFLPLLNVPTSPFLPSIPNLPPPAPPAPTPFHPPPTPPPFHSPTVPPPPRPSHTLPSSSMSPIFPSSILSHTTSASRPPVPAVQATITPAVEDLTPVKISRVQKHCRYAISALDYEDAEQARKELRAALTLLGG
ncbi:hypothetical protein PHLCEN_2v8771 [Hermanssonia centrifuga]|uniref:DUF605-domain-containing protein n=1 Tax=Hermanssonia centrifuga TaxID=98765 RepID=A0A2R6NSJ2_9APHY|nr:hypothetical protein PHLCEN_2v8771 [Hermanssonia centrifuga]